MRLENKVAIITGAARGIGKKTAEFFAREGAEVIIADYDVKRGKESAEEINNKYERATFIEVDVSKIDSAENLVKKTINKFGKLDILVNNAGITSDGFLTKMNKEQWYEVIDINLNGVFNCSKFAAEKMMEKGKGVILDASSIVGLYGNIGQTNYAASKFGVIGLTKTWAKELGPKGIRVNAVAPGYINTAMMDTVPEKVLNKFEEKTPLKRLGETEDIANVYLFLASDEAAYVNGEIISVDGGLVLG